MTTTTIEARTAAILEALDALGKDESGADEIIDRYAEEIFYARA